MAGPASQARGNRSGPHAPLKSPPEERGVVCSSHHPTRYIEQGSLNSSGVLMKEVHSWPETYSKHKNENLISICVPIFYNMDKWTSKILLSMILIEVFYYSIDLGYLDLLSLTTGAMVTWTENVLSG